MTYLSLELRRKMGEAIINDENSINSNPPTGDYRVTNIYVRATGDKLIVEYDDTPTP